MKYELTSSGIDWIGNVPKHWRKEKIFRAAEFVTSGGTPRSGNEAYYDGDIYWIQSGDLNDGYVTDTEKKITQDAIDNSSAKIFPKDTLLVAMYGATIGKLGIQAMEAATNQACCGIYPTKRIELKFLFYFFHAVKDKYISDSYGGGQPNISQSLIKQTYFFVPDKIEQIAIAKYLEKACADLDRVIEIKHKQIENLQQQLKSQTSNWFTKGNQSELKKTDSPIIPEIPKNWQLLKLKRVLEEKLKYGANESGDLDNPDDPRYIRITDFDDDGTLRDDTFKSLPPEVAKEYLLSEGDILFARSGATVGKTFIFKNYKGIACYAGYLIKAVTLKYKMLPDYLYYYTKTKMYEDWKNLIFTQATIQNIGADKYQYLPVPVPPIEEQKDILRKTELLNKKVKTAQSTIEKQITTLMNYKKSLIHEVITGKKQVYGLSEEKSKLQTAL